ncbi:phosphate propanoyltransferase [Thermincola potens]|uniref:Phosphate propanoyltransferase n=1 Tax=Thermincola potens (strain JR) TaxID=635013 RepID=D5XBV0_THEPJ|nr:phosphate propanoyltransferase [Thermincola potens]ADG81498.1 Propanediol utilization protein [Thermincola potens JR]
MITEENQLVQQVLEELTKKLQGFNYNPAGPEEGSNEEGLVPIGISNRHVHLARQDVDLLFGPGYELSVFKELQPGQYAARETVTLAGPKGIIEKVRVLGPVRKKTQVEISRADGFKLGINPPVRDSGDLEGTPGLIIIGPRGAVTLENGVIIARRHIHMSPGDAERFGVQDGSRVDVEVPGLRGVIFKNVLVRVHKDFELEMHIDVEEGNAAGLNNQDRVRIIGPSRGTDDDD